MSCEPISASSTKAESHYCIYDIFSQLSCSLFPPLFLLCPPEAEPEPETEESVVSVVTLLCPLLVDLKLVPDLLLW